MENSKIHVRQTPSTDLEICDLSGRGSLVVFISDHPDTIQTILHTLPPLPSTISFDFQGLKAFPLYFMNHGEAANNGTITLSNQRHSVSFTLSRTGVLSPPDFKDKLNP